MARTWTAEKQRLTRGVNDNEFAIFVDILYTASDGQTVLEKEWRLGVVAPVSLVDPMIAEHARRRIRNVLEAGDAMLDGVALGAITLPPDPSPPKVPDPQLVADAGVKLQQYQDARERAFVSPDAADKSAAVAALDAFLTAKAAVDASAAASVEAKG